MLRQSLFIASICAGMIVANSAWAADEKPYCATVTKTWCEQTGGGGNFMSVAPLTTQSVVAFKTDEGKTDATGVDDGTYGSLNPGDRITITPHTVQVKAILERKSDFVQFFAVSAGCTQTLRSAERPAH
jgi:hypothetical protein